MSRLFLTVTAAVSLAFSPLFAVGDEQQGDQDNSWKSLYSVVSQRGVRVNMVQPPPAPAPEEPAADDAAAPETAPPEVTAPETAAPEAATPELTEPEAPATAPDATEAPAEAESTPARAGEETESPGDAPAAPPVLTPESLGPVRARITDLGQPDAVPMPDDVSPMPQQPPAQTTSVVSAASPCASSVCSSACGHAGGCGLRSRRQGSAAGENPNCFCQMPQHLSYFPEMHGYYYFRPYNWTQIAEQQRTASEWGEDPRNPYGRQLFEQVYADYLAEKDGEAAPLVVPQDTVVPLPPEGN